MLGENFPELKEIQDFYLKRAMYCKGNKRFTLKIHKYFKILNFTGTYIWLHWGNKDILSIKERELGWQQAHKHCMLNISANYHTQHAMVELCSLGLIASTEPPDVSWAYWESDIPAVFSDYGYSLLYKWAQN